jgi:hypothetical protein
VIHQAMPVFGATSECGQPMSAFRAKADMDQHGADVGAAFKLAGWSQADRLGLASSWRMIRSFVFNSPYPTAPFSTLYLFGRGQDVGFQKAIDNSPRKRHHIRFWALSLAYGFWLNRDRPPDAECVHWIGAGTKEVVAARQ